MILPSIATGVLLDTFTNGAISVQHCIIGQFIGGLLFSFLSGSPMVIITTTLASAIFTKVITSIAQMNDLDFMQLYTLTGFWSAFYLITAAIFNLSNLIQKIITKSTKELITLFIAVAFVKTALFNLFKQFQKEDETKALLSLILTFGTVWLGRFLFNFMNTKFFTKFIRDNISGYALPCSVISMSLIGSFLFQPIAPTTFPLNKMENMITMADFSDINGKSILLSNGLGLCFAILVFMTQNIYTAIVDSPENKLVKGT